MTPLVKWIGGKRKLAQKIVAHMPDTVEGTYFEPFAGAAAVFCTLWNAGRIKGNVVLADHNRDLIALYAQVRDDPQTLIANLVAYDDEYRSGDAKQTEALYYRVRAEWNGGEHTPSRFVFLKQTAFNGLWRVNKAGKLNAAWGKYDDPSILDEPNITAWHGALQGVALFQGDTLAWTMPTPASGDVVYLDPPYVGTFDGYTADGFSDAQQDRLLTMAADWSGAGAFVAYSNSGEAEERVRRLWPDVNVEFFSTSYTVNRDPEGRKGKLELFAYRQGVSVKETVNETSGGIFLACVDLETFLIEPGGSAPPLVCAGWTVYDEGKVQNGIITVKGESEGDFHGPVDALILKLFADVRTQAAAGRVSRFVNQNIPFDFGVLCQTYPHLIPHVFAMYDEGLVDDTMIREQLTDIAAGSLGWVRGIVSPRGTRIRRNYTLKDMAKRRLDVDMDKTTWRMGYADLVDVPLARWPQGAKDYAVDDTGIAIDVYLHQRGEVLADIDSGEVPNSLEQCRAHWSLHLMSLWGIRTEGSKVARYKHELDLRLGVLADALSAVGFIRGGGIKGKKAGSKDKKLIEETILELNASPLWPDGHELARTEKGAVAMTAAAMDDLLEALDLNLVPVKAVDNKEPVDFALDLARSLPSTPGDMVTDLDGHPVPKKLAALALLAWHTSTQKTLGTYIPPLEAGAKYPINCRYQPLVESGRTSCSSPNLQNLPKERGVRECYRARPGTVFSSVDYEALELHTLAQACLTLVGKSKLAEALNEGVDPHLLLAVQFLLSGITYDEGKKIRKDEGHPRHKEVVHARNMAKIANFGLPGALSAKTLVRYAKAGGIIVDLDAAMDLKAKWFKAWPEMKDYFKKIGSLLYIGDDGEEVGTAEQLFSARMRGGARYTALCNTMFQGLAADLAKVACYEVAKACYVPGHNPILFGSRSVVFVHDEIIMEHPIETAHERAMEQARIMIEAGRAFCPDVPLKAEPALMHFWTKDAVAVYDDNKRLIPWVEK